MRPASLLTVLAVVACASPRQSRETEADAALPAKPATMGKAKTAEPQPKPARPFPAKVRSLRLTRSVAVHVGPDGESANLGTVARDTRVDVTQAVKGPGCDKRWIEIVPRGWVCETYLEPNKRGPRGVELPKLGRGDIVPGRFGRVTGDEPTTYKESTSDPGKLVQARKIDGSVTVREQGVRVIGETTYWHIGGGEWIAEGSVRVHQPAKHRGVRLGDDTGLTLPIAFAIDHKDPIRRVQSYTSPSGAGGKRRVLARTVISLEERHEKDGTVTHYRIDDKHWVQARDVIIVEAVPPPPTTGPDERWVDIDLDRQTLVAYEGSTPIYATFVSSGRRANATETGIYRVWIKFAETTMNGQMADEPSYSMATVPWTQFYAIDIALHTAYWHDKFGIRKSHGCVNLSPRDARFLYFWTEPQLPAGWSMAHGKLAFPGSMVRVRSKADPKPAFKGYAKKIYEMRAAQASR